MEGDPMCLMSLFQCRKKFRSKMQRSGRGSNSSCIFGKKSLVIRFILFVVFSLHIGRQGYMPDLIQDEYQVFKTYLFTFIGKGNNSGTIFIKGGYRCEQCILKKEFCSYFDFASDEGKVMMCIQWFVEKKFHFSPTLFFPEDTCFDHTGVIKEYITGFRYEFQKMFKSRMGDRIAFSVIDEEFRMVPWVDWCSSDEPLREFIVIIFSEQFRR